VSNCSETLASLCVKVHQANCIKWDQSCGLYEPMRGTHIVELDQESSSRSKPPLPLHELVLASHRLVKWCRELWNHVVYEAKRLVRRYYKHVTCQRCWVLFTRIICIFTRVRQWSIKVFLWLTLYCSYFSNKYSAASQPFWFRSHLYIHWLDKYDWTFYSWIKVPI